MQLSVRQWLILSWLLCLALPRLLFEVAQQLQHALAPALTGPSWLIGPLLSALLTALVTILGVGWLIGRSVLGPLAAMQQAARQIAGGEIGFSLPPSRVREVNEVAAAFTAMGDGLRAAISRQAALEQERRMLIGSVAHDLRTPLFALRGYIEGLEQGLATTPEKTARYLAICREQAAVLNERINSLFDYARLEYLEQPLRREPVSWDALAAQIAERIQPAAGLRSVGIELVGPPCVLEGDQQLLMRMLENLLDNAVAHTPAGGVVELHWRTEPGRLCFSVADTGAGFAAEDLAHVFVPMYRGDRSRGRPAGGAGLGLAIAQRIAQAHGGGLSAANRQPRGAELAGWLASAAP